MHNGGPLVGAGKIVVRRISAALALALVVAVVPGGAGLSQTVPSSAPPTKPEPDPNVSLQQPIVFYLARGEPDACGRGCSEWIAAEGKIDPGAAARLRAFLAKTRATRLPIYIHSPGGLTLRAFEMGRFIRERGMTIGVSKTAPEECKAIDEKGCSALKRSGKTLTAELTPLGVCASACVYFLAAGKVRQVPPGAKVGVHRGQMVRLYADGHVTVAPQASQAKVSASDPGLRKYLNEMGVDSRLTEIASKIPHEKIYFLSRDEIANLRIDGREFQETGWIVMSSKTTAVRKFFVEAKGPEHKEFRISVVSLSCFPGGRTQLSYFRGLASDEGARAQAMGLMIDGNETLLTGGLPTVTLDSVDTGGSFGRWGSLNADGFLKQAAKVEYFTIASGVPGQPLQTAGATQLSTAGLSRAIAVLREKCDREAISRGAVTPQTLNPQSPKVEWPKPEAPKLQWPKP